MAWMMRWKNSRKVLPRYDEDLVVYTKTGFIMGARRNRGDKDQEWTTICGLGLLDDEDLIEYWMYEEDIRYPMTPKVYIRRLLKYWFCRAE